MKFIILFEYEQNVDICISRLKQIKKLNPNNDIYGLYTGKQEYFNTFDSQLNRFFEANFAIENKSEAWKQKNKDLCIQQWYNLLGHKIRFKFLIYLRWDALILDSIENIYEQIPLDSAGILSKERIDSVLFQNDNEIYKKVNDDIETLLNHFNIEKTNNYILATFIGGCFAKSFLQKFSELYIPEDSFPEIRFPVIAKYLGENLYDLNIFESVKLLNINTQKGLSLLEVNRVANRSDKPIIYPINININNLSFLNKTEKDFCIEFLQFINDDNRFWKSRTDRRLHIFDLYKLQKLELDEGFKNLINNPKPEVELLEKADGENLIKKINNSLDKIISDSPMIDNIVKEMRSPKFNHPTYSISLNPDSNCNFSCSYCFKETMEKENKLSLEKQLAIIDDFVFKLGGNQDEICLSYRLTSEPFINVDEIEKVVNHIQKLREKTKKDIIFHFNTNGTILNQKVINIMKMARGENGLVHISLDGPKEVHDKNRIFNNGKSTYDTITETIKILKKNGLSVACSSVITNEFPYPYDIFQHHLSLGIDQVLMQPVRPNSQGCFKGDDIERLIKGYSQYFAQVKKWLLEENKEKIDVIKEDFVIGFLKQILSEKQNIIRCDFTSTSVISVDSKGDFYPCDSFMGQSDYKIGSINEGFYKDKIYQDITTFNRTPCNECRFQNLCGGTCYWSSFVTNGNINDTYEAECQLNKFLISESLDFILNELDDQKIERIKALIW